MFTDIFIQLPIKTVNQRQVDLTGKEEFEDAMARVNPIEICEYFSVFEEEQDATSINLNNGHTFVCYLAIEDLEQKLNSWQK